MHLLKKIYSETWLFSFILLLFFIALYALLEIKNHRFGLCDFEVYYVAASRIVHGENLYRPIEDGFYHYKYSPISAMYFIPFALVPYSIAKLLYWVFLGFLVCLGFYLVVQMLDPAFRRRTNHRSTNNLVLLAALVLVVHIARELELGQVNHLLLVIYICVFYLYWKKNVAGAGILVAASVFLKPFAFIFLPWLIMRKEWKMIAAFCFSLIIFAILPAVFIGFDALHGQYESWFKEISIELSNKQSMLAAGNHTLFSILARYSPLRFTPLITDYVHVYQLAVLGLIGAAFLWMVWKGLQVENSFFLEGSFLVGLIPLLSFTSYNAFGFVEVAVFILLFYYPRLSITQKILAVAGMILSGGNIYELVGRRGWFILNDLSLVAIGTVMLLVTLLSIRQKQIF